MDRTLEYSRPLRGLKLWLAFTVHGADAIRLAIERNLEEAQLLAVAARRRRSLRAARDPQLSAVCFRHLGAGADQLDAHNTALARAVAADGRILLASAQVDGAVCLRACLVNHRTTADDVRAIPAVTAEVAASLPAVGVAR